MPAELLIISFVLQADHQLVTGSILFSLIFVAESITTWIGVRGVSVGVLFLLALVVY